MTEQHDPDDPRRRPLGPSDLRESTRAAHEERSGADESRWTTRERRRRRGPRRPGRPRGLLVALGVALVLVMLGVATCSVDPAGLAAPYGPPVEGSSEDAASVLTRGADALRGVGETRTLDFTLTEAEATSVLSLGMLLPDLMQAIRRIPRDEIRRARDLEEQRARVWREADQRRREMMQSLGVPRRVMMKLDPRLRSRDVQVRFLESGEVVVAGYLQAWAFRLPALFVVTPRAESGELRLEYERGRLGRLPAPELVFDLLGRAVASAVLLGREHAEVDELTVTRGRLHFAGRLGR